MKTIVHIFSSEEHIRGEKKSVQDLFFFVGNHVRTHLLQKELNSFLVCVLGRRGCKCRTNRQIQKHGLQFKLHASWAIAEPWYEQHLTKVAAHSWDVWVVTCLKLCWCLFSLSSAGISNAYLMEEATSVMFHGFTKIAPAPRDCAAPAN